MQGHDRPGAAFFGRRKGPRLRPRQAELFDTLLPKLALDIEDAPPADPRTLFDAPVDHVFLEIGFGGGEHLFFEAERQPDIGFIGVEPFVNGMAKMLARLGEMPLANVRLYHDDAVPLLEWLPTASLARIDLLYPDPWPKKRHWKRRFVNPANLDRFARALEPGGLFRFASDIETYVDWTLLHGRDHPAFSWCGVGPEDWRRPYENWPGTRYEAKALREGRTPAYLIFERR